MAASVIYRNALLYEALMLALYGRYYGRRLHAIADLIPAGASVLDLCCGPGRLYRRHLRAKSVQYLGFDLNPRFVARVRRLGAEAEVRDLKNDEELPPADYVLMQASLYHFLPDAASVVDRMLRAARKRVVIAEPIRNLSDAGIPLLSALARRQADPGTGRSPHRFTGRTLDELMKRYAGQIETSRPIPGGREQIFVLRPAAVRAG